MSAAEIDGIFIGRVRAVRLLVGWSVPILIVLVLGGAWWYRGRPADGDLPTLATLILASAAAGSVLQTLLRIELGHRSGFPVHQLTLTAIGFRSSDGEPDDGPRAMRRLLLTAGPTALLLTVAVVVLLLSDFRGSWPWRTPELVGLLQPQPIARTAAMVWLAQSVLMGLPIPGSIGRQLLLGVVERTSGERGSTVVRRHVDRLQGVIGIALAAAALWQWQREPIGIGFPAWPFLMGLAVLVWTGRSGHAEPHERLDSDSTRQRRLSWWSRLRIRRAQRAERGEAVDAARLDDILERLHRHGIDSLSAAERSLLRRVSQRLRQNRDGAS